MTLTKLLAGAGLAATLAFGAAGVAQASTVYTVTTPPGCTTCGSGPYGTITVNGSGTDTLQVTVQFNSGDYFNTSGGGGFDAVAFSLVGDPTATITNLSSSDFSTSGITENTENGFHEDGVGYFDYAIDYVGPNVQGSLATSGIQTLTFDINSSSPLSLDPEDHSGTGSYFAVDLATTNSPGSVTSPATGAVGALLESVPVPEPGTWALLILGIGMVGATMRRRTKIAFA